MKQHIVPKCQLKHFSDDKNKVFVYKKEEGEMIYVNVEKVLARKDFYTDDRKENKYEIENDYFANFIESNLAKLLNYITDKSRYTLNSKSVLDMEHRKILNKSTYSQLIRTTGMKRHIDNNIGEIMEDTLSILKEENATTSIDDIELLKKMCMNTKNIFLGIQKHESDYERTIAGMNCVLLKNNTRTPFIISDNPVVVANEYECGLSVYVDNPNSHIIFPLTKDICAHFFHTNSVLYYMYQKITGLNPNNIYVNMNVVDIIKGYNSWQFYAADKYVITCSSIPIDNLLIEK